MDKPDRTTMAPGKDITVVDTVEIITDTEDSITGITVDSGLYFTNEFTKLMKYLNTLPGFSELVILQHLKKFIAT